MASEVVQETSDLEQLADGKWTEKNSKLVYSLLSGYNFYRVPYHYCGQSPCLGIHVNSQTYVRITPIGENEQPISIRQVQWHKRFILKPMLQDKVQWPIDLIESQEFGSSYILAYVFPVKTYPDFQPMKTLLYQSKTSPTLDWRKKEIRQYALGLAGTLRYLHENGILYNDFSVERMYYSEKTKQVFFRHTTAIREIRDTTETDELERLDVGTLAPEFAAPLYSESFAGFGSVQTDCYALSAMLFRLMIGRLPYEGKGLSGICDAFDPSRDTDSEAHEHFFEEYNTYTHFIFDPNDPCNELGGMSENDLPRERWEKLPQGVKTMFQVSLGDGGKNAAQMFSAAQWMEAIEGLNEVQEGRRD